MKRKYVLAPSGSKLEPWTTFAATVPPVTLAWYQRMVAFPPVAALQFVLVALTPRWTVWSTQSDSAPPRVRVLGLRHRPDGEHVGRVRGRGCVAGRGVRPAVGLELRERPRERRRRGLVPVDVELVDRER